MADIRRDLHRTIVRRLPPLFSHVIKGKGLEKKLMIGSINGKVPREGKDKHI